MYTRSELSSHFQVNTETIRRWSRDFANWLSPSANDSNRSQYTDDDVRVLSYVSEAYQRNEKTDDIIASVAGGARGDFDGYLRNYSVQITEADAVAINRIRNERDGLQKLVHEYEIKIAVLESKLAEVPDASELREQIAVLKFILKQNGIDPETGKPTS